MNGEVHGPLVTQALCANAPYYPHPCGIDAEAVKKVQTGDIVFTILNADASINALLNSSFDHGVENNNRVLGISCLCGLGEHERNPENIQRKIVVLGIVEQGDAGNLFNIIRQGILTVINNGDETINNGDDVMAYCPTVEEMGNGGYGTRADTNGVVKLWFRPFSREKHSLTPKPLYQCLRALRRREAKCYLPTYRNTCQAFLQGAKDMALVAVGSLGLAAMQEICRGSEVEMLRKLNAAMKTAAFDSQYVEDLFPLYSEKPHWFEPAMRSDSTLNKIQAGAAGTLLAAVSALDQDYKKDIVGKCMTTALPGQPFSLQVNK
jgi:hypothetical protein